MLWNPNFYTFSSYDIQHQHLASMVQTNHHAYQKTLMNDALYGSNDFRMYTFKIKKCSRTKPHDWTACPFAHPAEKAQRRDPRKFRYAGIACPAHRAGTCQRGENCQFAHGIFEYWLHPTRYRTRKCISGLLCDRKVCFFAHTWDEMRFTEAKQHIKFCRYAIGPRVLNDKQFGGGGNRNYYQVAESGMQYPVSAAVSYGGTGGNHAESSTSAIAMNYFENDNNNYGDITDMEYATDFAWIADLITDDEIDQGR
ncbi:hypothetical protein ACFE04_026899 [Oxalis oulophora]